MGLSALLTVTREPEYRSQYCRYKTWRFLMIPHLRAFQDSEEEILHLEETLVRPSVQTLRSFNDVGGIHWNRHLSNETHTNVRAMCRIGRGAVRV